MPKSKNSIILSQKILNCISTFFNGFFVVSDYFWNYQFELIVNSEKLAENVPNKCFRRHFWTVFTTFVNKNIFINVLHFLCALQDGIHLVWLQEWIIFQKHLKTKKIMSKRLSTVSNVWRKLAMEITQKVFLRKFSEMILFIYLSSIYPRNCKITLYLFFSSNEENMKWIEYLVFFRQIDRTMYFISEI